MKTEPVITAAAIIGLVQAAVVLAVSMGWLDLSTEQQNNVYAFAAALLALIFPLLGAWYARGKTTPLANPTDEDGAPLSRADNSPTLAQVRGARVKK